MSGCVFSFSCAWVVWPFGLRRGLWWVWLLSCDGDRSLFCALWCGCIWLVCCVLGFCRCVVGGCLLVRSLVGFIGSLCCATSWACLWCWCDGVDS